MLQDSSGRISCAHLGISSRPGGSFLIAELLMCQRVRGWRHISFLRLWGQFVWVENHLFPCASTTCPSNPFWASCSSWIQGSRKPHGVSAAFPRRWWWGIFCLTDPLSDCGGGMCEACSADLAAEHPLLWARNGQEILFPHSPCLGGMENALGFDYLCCGLYITWMGKQWDPRRTLFHDD